MSLSMQKLGLRCTVRRYEVHRKLHDMVSLVDEYVLEICTKLFELSPNLVTPLGFSLAKCGGASTFTIPSTAFMSATLTRNYRNKVHVDKGDASPQGEDLPMPIVWTRSAGERVSSLTHSEIMNARTMQGCT
jgi:hypothetical protein